MTDRLIRITTALVYPWARPRQSSATKHHLRFRQLQAWSRRYERGPALAAASEP
jgi:hypothetical protein